MDIKKICQFQIEKQQIYTFAHSAKFHTPAPTMFKMKQSLLFNTFQDTFLISRKEKNVLFISRQIRTPPWYPMPNFLFPEMTYQFYSTDIKFLRRSTRRLPVPGCINSYG